MPEAPEIALPQKKLRKTRALPADVLVLFFIWPLGAFIHAIRNYRAAWTPRLFVYFSVFLGFTFVLFGDAERVALHLEYMHSEPVTLHLLFEEYWADDTGVLDIFYRLVTFVVAFFTSDHRFLNAVLAGLMGYFIARSVWFLLQQTDHKLGTFDGLILIALALTVQLWYIGGRWNLAAIVFAYGVLRYFYSREIRFLFLAALSVLIHWTFFFSLPVLVAYALLGNRSLLFYLIFVTSFFFAFVEIETIRSLFDTYAPTPVLETRSSYLHEGVIEERELRAERVRWYIQGHNNLLRAFILVAVSFLFFFKKNTIRKSQPVYNLFNFSLLFFGIFNSISYVPSVGRFLVAGQWFFLAVLFLFIHETKGRFHPFIRMAGYVVLLVFIVVRFRIGADGIGLWTLAGNPFFVYFVENDTALIDMVKAIF